VACPGNGDDNYALSFRDLDPAAVRARLNQQHAEIERLEQELHDAQEEVLRWELRYVDAAKEIERLREALQEICDRYKHAACDPHAPLAHEFCKCVYVARAALKQEASE
jgi:DNA repair exonuclease SbcCD ATPase subunit